MDVSNPAQRVRLQASGQMQTYEKDSCLDQDTATPAGAPRLLSALLARVGLWIRASP